MTLTAEDQIGEMANLDAEIPNGYKSTKIIPNDWEIKPFGQMAEITMGQSPIGTSYNRNGVGVPLINGPTEFTKKHPIKIQWTTQPTNYVKMAIFYYA